MIAMRLQKRVLGALVLCSIMLTGCNANQTMAQEKEVSSTNTPAHNSDTHLSSNVESLAEKERRFVKEAFGLDLNDIPSDTDEPSESSMVHHRYAVEDGAVVIEWRSNLYPSSLYHFTNENRAKDQDLTNEASYSFPDTIGTIAQTFLDKVFHITTSSTPEAIYGYQNRIGVLLHAGDNGYFHVQFMPGEDVVIGCQHFDNLSDAKQFYTAQKAKKLS